MLSFWAIFIYAYYIIICTTIIIIQFRNKSFEGDNSKHHLRAFLFHGKIEKGKKYCRLNVIIPALKGGTTIKNDRKNRI